MESLANKYYVRYNKTEFKVPDTLPNFHVGHRLSASKLKGGSYWTSLNSKSGPGHNIFFFINPTLSNIPDQILGWRILAQDRPYNNYGTLKIDSIDDVNEGIEEDVDFLKRLKERRDNDEIGSIDYLFEYIDPLLDTSKFSTINQIIELFVSMDMGLRLAIAFLTIIHSDRRLIQPGQSRLKVYTRNRAIKDGLYSEQINVLLDGF